MIETIDLKKIGVRGVNSVLHDLPEDSKKNFEILNPNGQHSIACGVNAPLNLEIKGNAGFYCGGMNKHAKIVIYGHAGVGVGENMMSGYIHVKGDSSESAGATANGGLLVIEGNASSRCGISMKGGDIVIGGSVGFMSGFMAQSGNLVICGDAGDALGDSIYEAKIFVRGKVSGLGADCIEKEMRPEHFVKISQLINSSGIKAEPSDFRRFGSARKLYNFDVENADLY
tara:strand:+ start:1317 stop:2000 length:684 start_codon:yes stop_codon:yes gene_type:complete